MHGCYNKLTVKIKRSDRMRKEQRHLPKVEERKDCGAITCIHCVANSCTLEECDMFEKKLRQEN